VTIDDFLDLLDGVKHSGGRWTARCPAHEDQVSSLSVAEGDKGLLVMCHAGCETEDVVHALGLEMKDLFANTTNSPAQATTPRRKRIYAVVHSSGEHEIVPTKKEGNEKIRAWREQHETDGWTVTTLGGAYKATRDGEVEGVGLHEYDAETHERIEAKPKPEPKEQTGGSFDVETIYDYTDEEGELLFQAVRLRNPKSFRQRHRDGGKWVWNLEGVRRVLFGLPELLAGIKDGRSVWHVEGEKDVLTMRSIGFVATTNPMGASKGDIGDKWPDDFVRYFDGAPWVFVIGDCDEAGRKMAAGIAGKLHSAGHKVKVIELDAKRDDGYDLTDFIIAHPDDGADLLKKMAATTPRWTPRIVVPRLPGITTVKDLRQHAKPYDETKDYLGPLLHGGYRIFLLGPTGQGKTTFAMEAAAAAARGTDFLGWKGRGVNTLYLNLELQDELVVQAIEDARINNSDERFSLGNIPLGLHVDTNEEHRLQFERTVEDFDVVVVDPWSKFVQYELEYDSVRGVLAFLDGLRQRHPKVCMVFVAHTHIPRMSKGGRPSTVTMGDMRGFRTILDQADLVLTFQRIGGDTSRVRWEKNRSPRLQQVAKDGDAWKLEWSRGHGFVRLDERSRKEDAVEAMSNGEWWTKRQLAAVLGMDEHNVGKLLTYLTAEHLVEASGSERGGRGNERRWRLIPPGQQAIESDDELWSAA
jgi:hypothetical protein